VNKEYLESILKEVKREVRDDLRADYSMIAGDLIQFKENSKLIKELLECIVSDSRAKTMLTSPLDDVYQSKDKLKIAIIQNRNIKNMSSSGDMILFTTYNTIYKSVENCVMDKYEFINQFKKAGE